MNFRMPGPICTVAGSFSVSEGSLARVCLPVPANSAAAVVGPTAGPADLVAGGEAEFDCAAAIAYAGDQALESSSGKCARYVMAALARGFGAIDDATSPSTLTASAAMAKIEKALELGHYSGTLVHAKDYGPVLEHLDFVAQKSVAAKSEAKEDFSFTAGDVIVMQGTSESVSGHIQIYDGKQWISDFKQKDPLWPHTSPERAWKKEKPAYVIYRHGDD